MIYASDAIFPSNLLRPTNEGVDAWVVEWYSTHLRAMGEQRLDPAATNAEVYRFTWLRSFRHPVSLRLEPQTDGCLLIAKETDGAGGFEPGKLVRSDSTLMPYDVCESVLVQLRDVTWGPPPDEVRTGLDGARWIFEGIRDGQYRVHDIWSPSSPGPTARFRELGVALLTLAGVRLRSEVP